ncbi:unnamed protein product [Candidula unifasciata]|uniref:MI domain-containing protein n=1 Tax=Candidula unifasciata TaxID=100452 RepID=A0A8S3ZTX8_9EUPU|nr:unnamed protein product [Candidula unifasciata]
MGKHSRTKMPPSKTLSRKERRKEERKLKKARRDAFAQRKFDVIKTLKNVDTAFKAKCQQEKLERLKLKKSKKKVEKKEEKKAVDNSRVEGLRLAIQRDEKELKQLEKHLKFRKKKGKTNIPSSFVTDGLDYILEATDSEKIKTFEDVTADIMNSKDSSDSETDSDIEALLGQDDESDIEEEEPDSSLVWDPSAKATKSILKVKTKKPQAQDKKVKFAKVDDIDDENGNQDSDEEDDDTAEEDEKDIDDTDEEDVDASEESASGVMSDEKDVSDDDDCIQEDKLPELGVSKKHKRDEESELKEDIYGRLRDAQGNVVKPGAAGAYVPPAKRAMMAGAPNEALQKRLKGFVNKVSEGTIQAISSQVEALYLDNSRADVNETLTGLIMEAVVTPVLCPERLAEELAMLVAILHSNVGSEVGAFVLQKLIRKFADLLLESDYGAGKLMENTLLLIANIYNFKVTHSKLIFDIMEKFMLSFGERDIELLLHVLKAVGFSLRKDDPARLKQAILDIQAKAHSAESSGTDGLKSRIRFMLDVLMAIKNNNMRKIPGYDSTHLEHLRKIIKNFMKGHGLGEDQLTISLEDLLKADHSGKWWIVGSAWEGRKDSIENIKEAKSKVETSVVGTVTKQLLTLAKQQGMNTDIRRHIFCILGTSEDFEDAFSRLLRLGLNRTQEREIIHVLVHCCLNERTYNPFYSFLAQKFCTFDRRFTMTVQFTMWDKFKEIDSIDTVARNNLGQLLSHLLVTKSLSLSIFKVVEFGMESKKMIRLMAQVLTEVLSSSKETTVLEIFERIAPFPKLNTLRHGLQVFMKVHLKNKGLPESTRELLQERIEKADSAMFSHQASNMLL